MCNLYEETFSQTYNIGTIGHSGGNERHLEGVDRDPAPTCKAFVKSVVVLFLAFNRVY